MKNQAKKEHNLIDFEFDTTPVATQPTMPIQSHSMEVNVPNTQQPLIHLNPHPHEEGSPNTQGNQTVRT